MRAAIFAVTLDAKNWVKAIQKTLSSAAFKSGSLEATRRSFNKEFLLALAADFKKHGAAAIEKVRKTQPAAYIKICALLVPREMQIEHSSTDDLADQLVRDPSGSGRSESLTVRR